MTAPAVEGGAITRKRALGVLYDRSFRLYWTGQTLSGAGNALSSVALVFAAINLGRSTTGIGLVLLAGRVPVIGLTLAGGIIGDRYARRLVMIGSDSVRTVVQGITAALLLTGHGSIGGLAALQACSGAASALFGPASSGLVANLAPAGRAREANSMLSMSKSVAQIGAVAAGGAIVASLGAGVAFAVDAATFGASTITLALCRSPALQARPRQARSPVSQLGEGWSAVRRRPWLVAYTAHASLFNTLAVSALFVLGPVVAKRHLGGAPAWAAIGVSYGAGALGGSWLTLRWGPARPVLAAMAVSVGMAPLLVLLAIPSVLWAVLPAALVAGAQGTVYNTLTSACCQANVPDELLSRASSLVSLGALLGAPLGIGLAGAAADAVGTKLVLGAGAAWAVLSAGAGMALPCVRAPLPLVRASTPAKLPK
ncbi:MAG TPA: MFS transporter [Acidimicrobiales bacterium]|nr:MFS transporter [Acidimicrobiales bacterium]